MYIAHVNSENSAATLLHIKDLKVRFDTAEGVVPAVNGLDLTLDKGQILGIVGESGSGKSVTALTIMGLLPKPPGRIEAGSIVLQTGQTGQNLLRLTEEGIRLLRGKHMSMIFQEPMTSLNPTMRCGEQVAEAIRLHLGFDRKKAKERVLQLFAEVRLPDAERIYRAYPHQISGGQKQRVMIAMALSCEPDLLIADEPTTALDVTVQKSILELLRDLRDRRGMGVLFITHDLGVVAEIADRVLVMYKGHKVEEGEVSSVFLNPQHAYTKGLLACRPPLDRRLKKLPVVGDFMEVLEAGSEKLVVSETGLEVDDVLRQFRLTQSERTERMERITAQTPILEVDNLSVYFPKNKNWLGKTLSWLKAVDGISFKMYPGETLGLVGESGCGKTTLGRAILRLQPLRQGSIRYKGIALEKLSGNALKEMRKEIQIIFQDPYSSLNPRMKIGKAIKEPMTVHGLWDSEQARKKEVIRLLELVGLEAKHYDRYPHEFSGGQRQRIGIARALAVQPSFIVCDESVSALDVSVQAQVLNLLIDLRERLGLSYIFISHDLSVVKLMSDRMMVMRAGKLERVGDADEIYAQPENEYTQRLIDSIPKGI